MTYAIQARNVNDAYPKTIDLLVRKGVERNSRNGRVLEVPEPVSVTFTHPLERVLWSPARRINPFLHFLEPLYLLSGRRDVGYLSQIVSRFKEYSDDGENFAAAYGYRLRNPVDQIEMAIHRLKQNPEDRRIVLQIRTQQEISYTGKDTACNIAMALKIRDGRLHAHVFNRSNDAVWGGPAGGTNFCQFTVLQEYIAGRIGCGLGLYTATTDSLHAYLNDQWDVQVKGDHGLDLYQTGLAAARPLFAQGEDTILFDGDMNTVFDATGSHVDSFFFSYVFNPIWFSFCAYKEKDKEAARQLAGGCVAADWRLALTRWLE